MRKHFLRFVLALCLLYGMNVQADIGTVQCTSTPSNGTEFVPSWGMTDINEDQYSRYIYQWMYWSGYSRLRWLATNSDSTFEPDAFSYDYDGTTYGNYAYGYWNSDLPSPYVDTPFGDDFNEKSVTVGSGNAVFINYGKVYYTVTRMTNGGGSSSWVKLSSQRGRQVPFGCAGTWCSFGCDVDNNYRTIPFQDHFTAPGSRSYVWP